MIQGPHSILNWQQAFTLAPGIGNHFNINGAPHAYCFLPSTQFSIKFPNEKENFPQIIHSLIAPLSLADFARLAWESAIRKIILASKKRFSKNVLPLIKDKTNIRSVNLNKVQTTTNGDFYFPVIGKRISCRRNIYNYSET